MLKRRIWLMLLLVPAGTFAGAMSPDSGLHYTANRRGDFLLQARPQLVNRCIALQGQIDQVCDPAAVDAFAALAGLPLVEVPLTGSGKSNSADEFAVLITGDGGWARLDRDIAQAFVARGIPVVGLDSLRYFWKERTPDETARDVAAIISSYQRRWHRSHVHLLGYSFGADVLPFVVNRLPAALVSQLRTVTVIAPSDSATFEIHISEWLPGVTVHGLPTTPELARLPVPPLCIHGAGEKQTPCAGLPRSESVQIGSGHHLGGDAESIVGRILQPRRPACAGKEPCG
jgi:type IV secretory pathway VirJ component